MRVREVEVINILLVNPVNETNKRFVQFVLCNKHVVLPVPCLRYGDFEHRVVEMLVFPLPIARRIVALFVVRYRLNDYSHISSTFSTFSATSKPSKSTVAVSR